MRKELSKILFMLGISVFFGIASGLIFGYLYGQYSKFLLIALSISMSVWLLNGMLYVFLVPRIKALPRGKALVTEFVCFFIVSIIGFILPISILGKIYSFAFFKEKIFVITLLLLIVLFIMISGIILSQRFYKKLKEQELAAERLKASAMEAELKLLKSQINPHFLFNTLNSINALITQDPGLSRKMIRLLAELLRQVLDSHQELRAPLKKELGYARLYLEIENIRFKEKLKFHESVDPQLLDIPFPSMVLQPLVENAVKHGVHGSKEGGSIELNIQKKGNHIQCRISNSVSKTGHQKSLSSPENGVGLSNIRQRLDLLYKDDYHFHAEYADTSEFVVDMVIPIES